MCPQYLLTSETSQSARDVLGYTESSSADLTSTSSHRVEIDLHTVVELPLLIVVHRDLVLQLEDVEDAIQLILRSCFDEEIIYNEGENNRLIGVSKHTRSSLLRREAMERQVRSQLLVREQTRLWVPIHASSHLREQHALLVDQASQFELVDDVLGELVDVDLEVCLIRELRLQIEILDVGRTDFSSWRRDMTIDQRLDLSPCSYW